MKPKTKRSPAQIAATKRMLAGAKARRSKPAKRAKVAPQAKTATTPRKAAQRVTKRKQRTPAQLAATARMLAAKSGTASTPKTSMRNRRNRGLALTQ